MYIIVSYWNNKTIYKIYNNDNIISDVIWNAKEDKKSGFI
jgi:hypothetical protein